MYPETKAALVKELQSLLAKARLPEERELIGHKFAFTYLTAEGRESGPGDVVHVSGTILGIQICNKLQCFALLTTPLPEMRTTDTYKPEILFSSVCGRGRDGYGEWKITFLREGGEYDAKSFVGEFDLL